MCEEKQKKNEESEGRGQEPGGTGGDASSESDGAYWPTTFRIVTKTRRE